MPLSPTFAFPLHRASWYFAPIKNHIWISQKCIVRQSMCTHEAHGGRFFNYKINFFKYLGEIDPCATCVQILYVTIRRSIAPPISIVSQTYDVVPTRRKNSRGSRKNDFLGNYGLFGPSTKNRIFCMYFVMVYMMEIYVYYMTTAPRKHFWYVFICFYSLWDAKSMCGHQAHIPFFLRIFSKTIVLETCAWCPQILLTSH